VKSTLKGAEKLAYVEASFEAFIKPLCSLLCHDRARFSLQIASESTMGLPALVQILILLVEREIIGTVRQKTPPVSSDAIALSPAEFIASQRDSRRREH